MIRTIIWFMGFWGSLLFYMPFLYKAKKIDSVEARRTYADEKAKKWSLFLLKLAGANVEVIGQEKLPEESSVVYIANHQSNFDIPLMIGHMTKTKGFIAKVETKKIPLVRSWMAFMQCVFIDRDDIRQQVRAISEGVANIKNGQSIVIFPEGTRSSDGRLGVFKAGSLKLATKSGAPIVPVAIYNSMGLMKKGEKTIRKAKVKLFICDPIYITPEMNRETGALAERVKSNIQEALDRLEKGQ